MAGGSHWKQSWHIPGEREACIPIIKQTQQAIEDAALEKRLHLQCGCRLRKRWPMPCGMATLATRPCTFELKQALSHIKLS